jgi:hypothetical protein
MIFRVWRKSWTKNDRLSFKDASYGHRLVNSIGKNYKFG